MTHKRQRRRRNRLFKEDPKCYHCGCDLIKPEDVDASPNSATLDHIYSKPDPRRLDPDYINYTVLSCYKCNQVRGMRDQQKYQKFS